MRTAIEARQSEYIEQLRAWIAIPSVHQKDGSSAPFGKPIDDCLEHALDFCEQLGFRVFKDPNGYYGYAELGAGGAEACHFRAS